MMNCPHCGRETNIDPALVKPNDPMPYCDNCDGALFGPSEDYSYDDDDGWQPCDNCDLPDACEDFGCAIKSGVRRNYPIDGIF